MIIQKIEYRSVNKWRRITRKDDCEDNDNECEYNREEVWIRD